MPDTSPRLALPYILPAQAQKHVTHNEALRTLDGVVQLALTGVAVVAPPPIPAAGAVYTVGAAATGDWAGQPAGTLAVWTENAWTFVIPQEGWRGWDVTGARLLVWRAGAGDWVALAATTQDMLGINTTADTVNRLAVAAPATLFSHAGTGGHQLKINKATTADDAALLFQNAYTSHALHGLLANNDYSLKVSPDGAAFATAMTVPAATGRPDFPQGVRLAGGDILSFYQRGTWTPGFGAATTNPTGAAVTATGSYLRIGGLVYANFEMTFTNRGTGGAGNVQIRNLPFSAAGNYYGGDLRHAGVTIPGSGAPMMRSSGTTLTLFSTNGSDLLWANLPSGSGFSLLGTFIYVSDA